MRWPNPARLSAVPDDVALPRLALLRRPGDLPGRQRQHGFDAGPAHDIDPLIDRQPALLDEFQHRQKRLAVAQQKRGEFALACLPLLVDRVIASSQGGSPFRGLFTPIRFRIRENRRLNFQLRVGHRPSQHVLRESGRR